MVNKPFWSISDLLLDVGKLSDIVPNNRYVAGNVVFLRSFEENFSFKVYSDAALSEIT